MERIQSVILTYFNPRLREGGDDYVNWARANGIISIHASAKEATSVLQRERSRV